MLSDFMPCLAIQPPPGKNNCISFTSFAKNVPYEIIFKFWNQRTRIKYVNNTFQILVLNPNQSDGDY